jgi:hypothetical protein
MKKRKTNEILISWDIIVNFFTFCMVDSASGNVKPEKTGSCKASQV